MDSVLVGAFPVCVLSLFFKVCRFVFVCLFVSGGVLSGLSGGFLLCFVVFRRVSSCLFAETLSVNSAMFFGCLCCELFKFVCLCETLM